MHSEQNSAIPISSLYEVDFFAWTQQQAALLRDRHWNQIDLPNLIEEIESLGKQQRQELRNRLSILIGHLLKWEYQPERRSRSWLATIKIQRLDTIELLEENLSLQSYLEEALGKAYRKAIELAASEIDRSTNQFPTECPYGLAEILSDRSYPGEASELINPAE